MRSTMTSDCQRRVAYAPVAGLADGADLDFDSLSFVSFFAMSSTFIPVSANRDTAFHAREIDNDHEHCVRAPSPACGGEAMRPASLTHLSTDRPTGYDSASRGGPLCPRPSTCT